MVQLASPWNVLGLHPWGSRFKAAFLLSCLWEEAHRGSSMTPPVTEAVIPLEGEDLLDLGGSVNWRVQKRITIP